MGAPPSRLAAARRHQQRAPAAQELALDQRVLERHRRRAQPRQGRSRALRIVADVQPLGDERAVLDAAEQDPVEPDRHGRLARRRGEDLAHRSVLAEPRQRGSDALRGVEPRRDPLLHEPTREPVQLRGLAGLRRVLEREQQLPGDRAVRGEQVRDTAVGRLRPRAVAEQRRHARARRGVRVERHAPRSQGTAPSRPPPSLRRTSRR